MSVHEDAQQPRRSSVPTWLPVSVAIGTSLAVAIPIFMFRRARATALKDIVAPPRRALSATALSSSKHTTISRRGMRPVVQQVQVQSVTPTRSSPDFDSPGTGELLSAISKADTSTALLGGKAFLIATCLVGVTATGLVWGVQTAMGVDNVPDFAKRMRYWTNTYLSGITYRIHRAPESVEERQDTYDMAPWGVDKDWTWEEAEERMKLAYEKGGFTLWGQVALRELEAEARVERTKKQLEIEEQKNL